MDYLQKLVRQTEIKLFAVILGSNILVIGLAIVTQKLFKFNSLIIASGLLVIAALLALVLSRLLSQYLSQPLKALWQTILHLSPDSEASVPAPSGTISFGQELVENLSSHIFQLISLADKSSRESVAQAKDLNNNFIAQNLPLPLLVLDSEENIRFSNTSLASYIGIDTKDLIGKNLYSMLDMAFPSEDTFDSWLTTAKDDAATSVKAWERVKLNPSDNHPGLMFDLAAYYNRSNPDNNETILVLFDHTKQYSQDDQAISFVALSVHELRTPLTLLRGYIEVFEEELSGKLDPEMQSFMEKMQAQAEQLMAFVNNILNVARVDDDQLELKLVKGDWGQILTSAITSLSLRAKVRGISLTVNLADNLPAVAVDPISIQEVINNLIDNAIKYSGDSKLIDISSYVSKDGLIETTVQDYGRGIPAAALPNLFTKFYRDHHNRSQVGGTGLGLYLSKAIVTAHGGNIWVRSKEGEGSLFGFSLQPYDSQNNQSQNSGDSEMVRGAHGWIKNHSLYRR